jgi:O-antigen ligase
MPWIRSAIAGALLTGPALLGFFSGGYFDEPRLWAALVAWLLVIAVAVACPRPLPRGAAPWAAIAGLAGLTLWTALSIGWTPLRDAALADAQRLALYLGALIAGVAVFRARGTARAVEPALALGILALVVEGLSERLLPGLFTLEQSLAAPGRLLQPLTYWNAMGLLAAMGVLLCVRIAGDVSRPAWVRAAAAAATPALATGGYLTLSRGAIFAVIVGLVLLALLQPVRPQLRAMAVAVVCAAPAVAVSARLDGFRVLEGSASARRTEGLVMLAVLLLASAAAALAIARGPGAQATGRVSARARRGLAVAGTLVAVGVVVTFGVLLAQHRDVNFSPADGPENARLASAESIRGDFWRVARHSFADEPLRGVGSGGFAVAWLRERPILYAARDAHSLYLETAAELGLVGVALLLTFAGGVAASARRAFRRDPALAAGPVAVVSAWAVHAGLDWDWEVPSLTLVAILLAALLVARADEDEPQPVAPRPSVEERAPEPRRAEVAL